MDHKNGKKHLKNMGVDTKAVREDVQDVIAKLESMKRKAENPKKEIKYDLDARLEEVKRQEDREKAEKRERKRQKKGDKKEDSFEDGGGMDPAMAAMMG